MALYYQPSLKSNLNPICNFKIILSIISANRSTSFHVMVDYWTQKAWNPEGKLWRWMRMGPAGRFLIVTVIFNPEMPHIYVQQAPLVCDGCPRKWLCYHRQLLVTVSHVKQLGGLWSCNHWTCQSQWEHDWEAHVTPLALSSFKRPAPANWKAIK